MRIALHVALAVVVALFAHASRGAEQARADRAKIESLINDAYPDLEKLYTAIHTHPELSLHEEQTAKRLAEQLRSLGYEVTTNVGGHGVVAVLKNGPGQTLLIRTDLDALPVKEETGAAYASTVTVTDPSGAPIPVMHACGHDVHITCLVGVAGTMAALKGQWSGTLVLIGQPAEELIRGAKAMLDDRPDCCLALHVDAEVASGHVAFVSGYAMANSDGVEIVVRGVGGHGAVPHTTKDPVVIAAQTVLNLQTIASREVKPTDPVVVTVGSIHGGTKNNVIPDSVTLQLTVRTYKDEVREQVFQAIERIAKGTAATAGVPKELEPIVTIRPGTPSTYNTPELVERVTKTFRALLGDDKVEQREPSMGAEDFGLYGRQEPKIPIFMYRLGSVPPEKVAASKSSKTPLPSLHSSKYLPDREPTIRTGVLTMTAAALDLLPKQ